MEFKSNDLYVGKTFHNYETVGFELKGTEELKARFNLLYSMTVRGNLAEAVKILRTNHRLQG